MHDSTDTVTLLLFPANTRLLPGAVLAWVEKGKWVIEVDHRGAITIATAKLPQEQ
jgi:hypothetical protein